VNVKNAIQQFSDFVGVARLQTAKRYLYVLTLIAALGSLSLLSFSQDVQQRFTSNLSIFHPHSSDNLIQDRYVLLDDGPDNDLYSFTGYRAFLSLFLIAGVSFVISSVNSYRETFVDTRKSSPYSLSFAFLPLRSPPLFS
jgi:hypothetical protein